MTSGRDPGELGLYGFRKRIAGQYGLALASSADVTAPRIWDLVGAAGKRSSVLFVPPSYPVAPVKGQSVSCFLTPDDADIWTHPRPLAGELTTELGPYRADVDVRLPDRTALFEQLCALSAQHFAMARHLWRTRSPDLLVMVDIAPDRLHHAFLAEMDPEHPRYASHGSFSDVGERFYRRLDAELGALLDLADEDTAVLVVSDHGALPLTGCFLINQWLVEQGLLVLRAPCATARALKPELVDWSRTRVWAEGGYYARVFVNVRGREPDGCVDPVEVDPLLHRLRSAVLALRGPAGEPWVNSAERPRDLYREVRGDAPDLLVTLDALRVRALPTVGAVSLYASEDDRGPDAANHAMHGIFVAGGAGIVPRGDLGELAIQDVGVTALGVLGVPVPADWLGADQRGCP
jgi:predicted AlkP superfamily phosphohydrolase/phosphomutase